MRSRVTATVSSLDLHEPDKITNAVVSAVADAEGVSPLDLQPLTTAIDPDALEKFVVNMTSRPDEPAGNVEFSYSGYTITVTEDGNVSVTKLEASD